MFSLIIALFSGVVNLFGHIYKNEHSRFKLYLICIISKFLGREYGRGDFFKKHLPRIIQPISKTLLHVPFNSLTHKIKVHCLGDLHLNDLSLRNLAV